MKTATFSPSIPKWHLVLLTPTQRNIFLGNWVRSKKNTSKNHLCLFFLCQPVTRLHVKYSTLKKYCDLVLQLFLVAFSCFFMSYMVCLVPQNNSEGEGGLNNEKSDLNNVWIIMALFFYSLFNGYAGYPG